MVYIQTNFLSTTNLNLGLKIDILSPTRCWLLMVKKRMKCKYDCRIIFSQIGFLYALKLRSQTKEKQQCHCQPIYSLYGILCNKRVRKEELCSSTFHPVTVRWWLVGYLHPKYSWPSQEGVVEVIFGTQISFIMAGCLGGVSPCIFSNQFYCKMAHKYRREKLISNRAQEDRSD